MKIVIAPDAFKESLTSLEAAHAIQQGFSLAIHPADYVVCPMADGGTGTLQVIARALPLTLHTFSVNGPLFELHPAQFGIFSSTENKRARSEETISEEKEEFEGTKKTALIEMSEASGLHLVASEKRNPLLSSTYGTGELMLQALNMGCRKFIIGLGGSATCDGGMGALAALGVVFKDKKNQILKPLAENLVKIASIDTQKIPSALLESEIILAHDVENPFLGLQGALMYAPQKGANATMLEQLHKGFEHYAWQLQKLSGKNLEQPGLGAAGGLAFGLYAFLNATLTPGAPLFMKMLNLPEKMKDADLVITGEGKLDVQTLYGKTPAAVAKLAKSMNIPVIAFAASLPEEIQALYNMGIDAAFSIAPGPIEKEKCIEKARAFLISTAYTVARVLKLTIKESQ